MDMRVCQLSCVYWQDKMFDVHGPYKITTNTRYIYISIFVKLHRSLLYSVCRLILVA